MAAAGRAIQLEQWRSAAKLARIGMQMFKITCIALMAVAGQGCLEEEDLIDAESSASRNALDVNTDVEPDEGELAVNSRVNHAPLGCKWKKRSVSGGTNRNDCPSGLKVFTGGCYQSSSLSDFTNIIKSHPYENGNTNDFPEQGERWHDAGTRLHTSDIRLPTSTKIYFSNNFHFISCLNSIKKVNFPNKNK